jgi:hypothetical protein
MTLGLPNDLLASRLAAQESDNKAYVFDDTMQRHASFAAVVGVSPLTICNDLSLQHTFFLRSHRTILAYKLEQSHA